MSQTQYIVGIGGTMRAKSLSRSATQTALRIAAELGAQTEMLDLRALNLPMYNPDLALHEFPLEHQSSLNKLIDACRKATALVWCSPCYHGTVTGVFKNAIDFIELLGDDNPSYLTNRCVGVMAINDSKTFSAMSNSVHELRAWLAPTHVLFNKSDFDANQNLISESGLRRVTRLVRELMSFE
jgi:FMN reductase